MQLNRSSVKKKGQIEGKNVDSVIAWVFYKCVYVILVCPIINMFDSITITLWVHYVADLGEVEDVIFKKRREDDQNFRARNKQKRTRERQMKEAQRPSFLLQGDFAPKVSTIVDLFLFTPK